MPDAIAQTDHFNKMRGVCRYGQPLNARCGVGRHLDAYVICAPWSMCDTELLCGTGSWTWCAFHLIQWWLFLCYVLKVCWCTKLQGRGELECQHSLWGSSGWRSWNWEGQRRGHSASDYWGYHRWFSWYFLMSWLCERWNTFSGLNLVSVFLCPINNVSGEQAARQLDL